MPISLVTTRGCIIAAVLLLCTTWTAVGAAEVTDDTRRAAARTLGVQGLDAMDRGELDVALDRLSRAYELHRVPTLALWLGRVLERLGRLVAASERLLEATHLEIAGAKEEAQLAAQRDAAVERTALLARIPTLQIEAREPSLEHAVLSVDDTTIPTAALGSPLPMDPGEHHIVLRWPDRSASAKVKLSERQKATVVLKLDNETTVPVANELARASSVALPRGGASTGGGGSMTTPEWIALGVGAAGLATWGVTGLLALEKRSSLKDNCPSNQCPPAYHDDLDSYKSFRAVSTIGFVVGAVSASAFTVFVLSTSPKKEAQQSRRSVSGWVSAGSLGLSGVY